MKQPASIAVALCALVFTASAAAQAQGNPPPRAPRVAHVDATVRPAAFQGKCPVTLHFTARVTVVNPPAKVQYEWIRSDGAKSAPREILIKGTEGIIGGETWQLGGAGEKMAVWERLHVLSPNNDGSRNALVRIACQ